MKNFWIISLLFLVIGCDSKTPVEPPTPPTPSKVIEIDKTTLSMLYTIEEQVVNIKSNSEWEIEGGSAWCRVDKVKGSGDASVVVSVDKNEAYDQRKTTFVFRATKAMQTKADFTTLIVTQSASGGIIINSSDTTISRKGGEIIVELVSNVDYEVKCDEQWVKINQTKALVPDKKMFVVEANDKLEHRDAQIIFKALNAQIADTFYVKQMPTGTVQEVVEKSWDGIYRADIFYQIFTRSFADSDGDKIGDIKGVEDKLQYIKDLGCTGVWLTPINPSPSYHGYDVTDYKGVNPEFGTMQDFENLITKANQLGIKIVLDFVINHSSNKHPWFLAADADDKDPKRGYYLMYDRNADLKKMCESGAIPMIEDKKYNASMWRVSEKVNRYYAMFDGSMPDLNYGVLPNLNPVYGEILDAAKFWMSKGVAGLRLDAVKHIYQDSKSKENWEFLNKFYNDVKTQYPDVYMVGEVLGGVDETAPYFQGLPSLFHFDSWWKLEWAIQNETGRYYAKDMVEAINKFKPNRSNFNACIKLSNHDEDRAISKISNSVEKAKIAFAVIATTPGQPYIYYGEELGMSGMKDSDDKNVREPMLWGDSYYAKWFEPKNATESRLDNVVKQNADKNSLLNFYKEFAKLRNASQALSMGDINYPNPQNVPNELMVYTRSCQNEKLMVIVNVSNKKIDYLTQDNIKKVIKTHNDAKLLKMKNSEEGYIVEMEPLSVIVVEL